MDEQLIKLKIHYDDLEKIFKKRYYLFIFVLLISISIVEISFFQEDYFTIFVFVQVLLILPFFPNYLFIKIIDCPNCGKNYFTPFLASKDDIKSLLKSNPKCVNCGYEAEIISDYKVMY